MFLVQPINDLNFAIFLQFVNIQNRHSKPCSTARSAFTDDKMLGSFHLVVTFAPVWIVPRQLIDVQLVVQF